MNKERKPRTAKTASSYLPQLMKLPLSEQVVLVKTLKQAIDDTLQKTQQVADEAKSIVNGL